MDSKSDLKNKVRQQTGYTDTATLSEDGLDTAIENAKRHIRVQRSLPPEDEFEWFTTEEPARQDALFWWTCLFSKLQTGELDSQDLSIGAIEHETLLAKSDDEVTQWYRSAVTALNALQSGSIFGSVTGLRPERTYGGDSGAADTGIDINDLQ